MLYIIFAVVVINTFIQFVLMTKSANQERSERLVRDEISRNREELMKNLTLFRDSLTNQLNVLTQSNEQKLEKMRVVVEDRIRELQSDNSQKLEKMRETVDEKLHSTLEKRLNESFNAVSDRLEKVHQGLGEMQNLAQGVGDLKKNYVKCKDKRDLGGSSTREFIRTDVNERSI